MREEFVRASMLLGEGALNRLSDCTVAVFGVGGVGSYVVEALARSGIGNFHLIDSDTVSITNINRQIIATHKTISKYKVDVAKERILSINPCANVVIHKTFFLPDNSECFDFTKYDYVVDAVDTVTAKLEIVSKAKEANIPVISCMGTGNKIDPTKFEVTDIYKTSVCPLAKVMRRELKKRSIDSLKVVYSKEIPLSQENADNEQKRIPGSVAFVPSVAGLIIAGEVIKDLCNIL